MTWHYKTQSSCKGICKIVGNAVEFAVFHVRIVSPKLNDGKVRTADTSGMHGNLPTANWCRAPCDPSGPVPIVG